MISVDWKTLCKMFVQGEVYPHATCPNLIGFHLPNHQKIHSTNHFGPLQVSFDFTAKLGQKSTTTSFSQKPKCHLPPHFISAFGQAQNWIHKANLFKKPIENNYKAYG